MTGTVYLVGAGPGAADLLTVRAARLLAAADVVLHDALVSEEILALISPRARVLNVGKRAHRPSTDQAVISRLLVQAARRGGVVVRLKGGDPSIFGRAQEEIAACRRAGIAYVIVPGVTAALAAAADLGVSLTQRGVSRSVAFVTPAVARGGAGSEVWADAAAAADTAVIYMGKGEADTVRQALLARGVPGARPAALVAEASQPQRALWRGVVDDLAALAAVAGEAPAVLIVGDAMAEAQAEVLATPAEGLRRA